MHLYTLDVADASAKAKQLTSGKWEVTDAPVCRATGRSSTSPPPRSIRASGTSTRLPLDGGARTKITSMAGSNQAEVSPDESTLGLIYSYSTKPPEVFVDGQPAGRAGRRR